MVERPGRDVRHVVVRLQLAPGRLPAAARTRSDRPHLRHRRPLHRRRPLHGRRAPCGRPRRLGALHGRMQRAAAGPAMFGEGWREEWERRLDDSEPWLLRWLEEQTDGPYWRHGSLRPGLRADHLPDDDRRGLGRRLPQQHLPNVRGAPLPQAPAARPVGSRSQATSLPGPHVDLVPELFRWFGRWLRDDANGDRRGAAARRLRAPVDAALPRPAR